MKLFKVTEYQFWIEDWVVDEAEWELSCTKYVLASDEAQATELLWLSGAKDNVSLAEFREHSIVSVAEIDLSKEGVL